MNFGKVSVAIAVLVLFGINSSATAQDLLVCMWSL